MLRIVIFAAQGHTSYPGDSGDGGNLPLVCCLSSQTPMLGFPHEASTRLECDLASAGIALGGAALLAVTGYGFGCFFIPGIDIPRRLWHFSVHVQYYVDNIMNTISYTAIRANLAKTIDRVCNDHDPIIITRSQAKATVLISLEDYESMIETNYLLKSPANAARLKESIEEIEAMIAKKQKKKK